MQFESSSAGFSTLLVLFLNNLFQNKSFWYLGIRGIPSLELTAVAQIRRTMFFHMGMCNPKDISYCTVNFCFLTFSFRRLFPALKRVDIKQKVNKTAAFWTWSSRIALKKILRVSLRIIHIGISDHRDSCNKKIF